MILPGFPLPSLIRKRIIPVIASFSQSSNYGGSGVQLATVENMSDGLFEPFAATNTGTQWIRAHLEEEIFVEKIILGPSTTIGGWGATYLNNGTLQYSTNNGSSWNNIRTLSGYVNATNATTGTMQEEAIGAVCTDIRVLRSGYLAISEFKILA